ncbi:MAG: hypothetical protein SNJ71_00185 [Bacteroidales bacterium]
MWNINFYIYIILLLPIVKRSETMVAFLYCAVKQIEALYYTLKQYRVASKQSLQYSSQILSLEHRLQTSMNSSLIWIEDGEMPQLLYRYTCEDNEQDEAILLYTSQEAESNPTLYLQEEYNLLYHFVVHAPDYLQPYETKMKSIIDEYRYPDKRYSILFDNAPLPTRNYYNILQP